MSMKSVGEKYEGVEGAEGARLEKSVEWLKEGRALTPELLSREFNIAESTAKKTLRSLRRSSIPLEHDEDEDRYSLPVDDPRYLGKTEFHEPRDIANYLKGEIEGVNKGLKNHEWEEKESATVLALNETGWGSSFHDPVVEDGLTYKLKELEERRGEEYIEDNFAAVLNGTNPRVPRRSYKTARQAQRALGINPDKIENESVQEVANKSEFAEFIRNYGNEAKLPDEIPPDLEAGVWETEEEKKRDLENGIKKWESQEDKEQFWDYVERVYEGFEEDFDIEKNKQKITNMQDAIDVEKSYIDQLYDALDYEFPLYVHMGEQDEKNIEELMDLKIVEMDKKKQERLETLQEKIEERKDSLKEFTSYIEDANKYEELYGDLKEHIDRLEEGTASFRELEGFEEHLEEYDIEGEAEDIYEEVMEEQEKMTQKIRELELNENAMLRDLALGKFAKVFGWSFMQADQTEQLRTLAENEYKEYLHQLGEVKKVAKESDLMRFELGGFEIDVAHNLNVASDEPLITGFKKEKEKYKEKADNDADLFLTGHHGGLKATQYVRDRGEDANSHTWMVSLPTLMDSQLLEEEGEEEGLNLLKDVKRKYKGLNNSAATLLEIKIEEGPNGEKRRRVAIEPWSEEYLKNLGKQLNGEGFPGLDFTDDEDRVHIASRGDDQIGSPHSMRYLYQPLGEEAIDEDFSNIFEWLQDRKESDSEAYIFEGGDTLQGNDIFPQQMTEGEMFYGQDILDIKSEILSVFEDEEVSFESHEEYYEYLRDADLEGETQMALDYIELRNRAQTPINDIDKQGERVKELISNRYNELLEKYNFELKFFDGNHYNRNQEGLDEGKRMEQMIDSQHKEHVESYSGLKDGDANFMIGEESGGRGLQVKAKHRPTGRGSENVDKMVNSEIEESTDIASWWDKHTPAFAWWDDTYHFMPGSVQATSLFTKNFTSDPSEMGAVYFTRPSQREINWARFEHVAVEGKSPFPASESNEE